MWILLQRLSQFNKTQIALGLVTETCFPSDKDPACEVEVTLALQPGKAEKLPRRVWISQGLHNSVAIMWEVQTTLQRDGQPVEFPQVKDGVPVLLSLAKWPFCSQNERAVSPLQSSWRKGLVPAGYTGSGLGKPSVC